MIGKNLEILSVQEVVHPFVAFASTFRIETLRMTPLERNDVLVKERFIV